MMDALDSRGQIIDMLMTLEIPSEKSPARLTAAAGFAFRGALLRVQSR